jgi:hypothetical protein
VYLAKLLPEKNNDSNGFFWYNKILQAIKRYVKLGYDVDSGDDIESAIKDIAGIHVSNLNPNRNNGKLKQVVAVNLRI